ncbi:MAG: cobalamin B12-binding domain-containing protein [Candidatus Schekmanbacteria bacterium]|nr:cobalamin B12-binding domain-containing protein [Candidatus Schekmanbacteria bacterium]
MRILLIQPAKAPVTIGGEDVFIYEPLALEYIGAGVAGNHDVRILDMRLDKNLNKTLYEFNPDIVGITAYTVHVNGVKELFRKIKEFNPVILTVAGGHHASVAPLDFMTPNIDLVVTGEGVFAFNEIIRRFEKGENFDGIPGVAICKKDRLIMPQCLSPIELDSLPFPDRKLTAQYRKHYYSEWMRPLASIRTSKGCPYRCSFCALWKLAGGHYFRRKPEKVLEEIAGIEEEFIFFADDESLVDTERMKTLALLIKNAGIKKQYFLYGRGDTIAGNPELLELWKEIGLQRVFVGLEFFRDEDLKYIKKGSHVSDNEKAVKILQSLDIDIYASFIIRPEFKKEDFRAFIEYCQGLDLNFASFAMLTPLPGTDFFEEVKDKLITRNYDLFDFVHTQLPTAMPLKEFFNEYFELYKKSVPFRKSISFLKKFPMKEIPSILNISYKALKRIKNAYRDY